MTLINWDNTLSVGSAEIDDQHKRWIDILNEVHDDFTNISSKDKKDAFKAMIDYSRYHFAFEEEYMKKINHPLIREHWRLHKDFVTTLYEYDRKLNEGKIVLTSEIITILKSWLLDHIADEDKKYQVDSSFKS